MKSLILIIFFFCLVNTHICYNDDCHVPINRYLLVLHQVNETNHLISYMQSEICHNCLPCQITNCSNCTYPTHCPYNLTDWDHQWINDNQHYSQDWYYNHSTTWPIFAQQTYLNFGSCSCLPLFAYMEETFILFKKITTHKPTLSCQTPDLYFRSCIESGCNHTFFTRAYPILPDQTPNITHLPCGNNGVGNNNDSKSKPNITDHLSLNLFLLIVLQVSIVWTINLKGEFN